MKRSPWILAGIMALGIAPAANAMAMSREVCEPCSAMHKSGGMVIKPFFNRPNGVNGPVYTLLGVEMLRGSGNLMGGWGMYCGLDLGVKNASDGFHYGGFLLRHEREGENLSFSSGLLLGFGHTVSLSPTFTFNNVYFFGVLEPQVELSMKIHDRATLGLDLSYILTSNPGVAGGPALAVRVAMPFGHRGKMMMK